MSKPTRLEDLDVKELRRSAIEDFAVPVEADDNKKSVLAAFAEAGVDWSDYVQQHPEVQPDEPVVKPSASVEREPEKDRGNVITAASMKAEQQVATPVTASPVVADGGQPWLIKMTRENIRFDVKGYTFTREHPYALVKPEDVAYILEGEDGFRQAYPSELSEFYSI